MLPNDKRKNRSYLTMFYERNGIRGKSENSITSRAICDDLSPKSYFTCAANENTSCYFEEVDDSER